MLTGAPDLYEGFGPNEILIERLRHTRISSIFGTGEYIEAMP
jgi:hypothetical protein